MVRRVFAFARAFHPADRTAPGRASRDIGAVIEGSAQARSGPAFGPARRSAGWPAGTRTAPGTGSVHPGRRPPSPQEDTRSAGGDDRYPGQRERAAQAGIASMLGRGEDPIRGDIRAGAGRRGGRDERRLRFGDRQPSAADARALDLALIDRGLPDTDDLDVTGHRHHPKSLWPTRRPEGDVKMELLIVLLRRCRGRDAAAPAEPAGDPETLARRGGRASVLRQRPQPGTPPWLTRVIRHTSGRTPARRAFPEDQHP